MDAMLTPPTLYYMLWANQKLQEIVLANSASFAVVGTFAYPLNLDLGVSWHNVAQ